MGDLLEERGCWFEMFHPVLHVRREKVDSVAESCFGSKGARVVQDAQRPLEVALLDRELCVIQQRGNERGGFGFAPAEGGKRFHRAVSSSGAQVETPEIPLRQATSRLRRIACPVLQLRPRNFAFRAIQL